MRFSGWYGEGKEGWTGRRLETPVAAGGKNQALWDFVFIDSVPTPTPTPTVGYGLSILHRLRLRFRLRLRLRLLTSILQLGVNSRAYFAFPADIWTKKSVLGSYPHSVYFYC